MGKNEHWSFDKRIPLALVLAIFAQTAAGVWWASNISAQVGHNAARIASQERDIEKSRNEVAQLDRTTVRLVEQIEHMRRISEELKSAQVETNRILRQMIRD